MFNVVIFGYCFPLFAHLIAFHHPSQWCFGVFKNIVDINTRQDKSADVIISSGGESKMNYCSRYPLYRPY